jgi:hypothetical protein
VNHFLNLAHGIGVSLMCALLFYLAGLALTPRASEQRLRSPTVMLAGAATYVLLCWIAITARGLPLATLIAAFVTAVAAVSVVRFRWISSIVREHVPSGIGTPIAFVFFYIIAYALTLPPASDVFLPPAWNGNLDLLTHVQYAKHLLLFGSPTLESASFDYLESPAASYLLALMSMGYSQDPLRAAMPLLFALVSLAAIAVVYVARAVFRLPTGVRWAVVLIFLIGPLMRYVSAAYLIGWLTGFPIVVYVVWAARNIRSSRFLDAAAIAAFAAAYTLLFFLHPALVLVGIGIQTIALLLDKGRAESPALQTGGRAESSSLQSGGYGKAVILLLTISAGIPTVLLASAFFERVRWAMASDRMRAAFALSDVSPQMLVGWPAQISDHLSVELPAGVLALLLAAILPALMAGFLSRFLANHEFARVEDRRLVRMCAVYAAVILVAANIAVHAVGDPRLIRLPGPWHGIEQLGDRPFTGLTFKIEHDPGGLMAAVTRYYLPNKKVEIVSRTLRTRDLPFEAVSRSNPLLLQGFGCEGVGHKDVISIDRVGCVLLAPPTLEIGKRYPFNRTMLAVEYDGMGERDPGGRWTTDRTLSLRVTIDPQRTTVDRPLYLNILMDPFLQAGETPPHVMLTWGSAKRTEIPVTAASWINVPADMGDWEGSRLWTLRVRIDFPDRRRILFRDLMVTEEPPNNAGS